ncbi:hypothetical protein PybrP1_006616 [[Pythium] brassicae (nom. inval.)]|nr:hypothetical protein PybrP1_006616 [[Pythium] brassicae (nom. inval.)]
MARCPTASRRLHTHTASALAPDPLSSSMSLQELEQQRQRKAASLWVARYHAQAKCELVDVDVAPLLERFESASLYHSPQRQPLAAALQEMAHPPGTRTAAPAATPQAAPTPALRSQTTLKRQATQLVLQRRADRATPGSAGVVTGAGASRQTTNSVSAAAVAAARAPVVPTRFLYDATRWPRSGRCDYCSCAGGDLACATCNVVAHARCFLRAYAAAPRKRRGAFVAPTRFAWLCAHCEQSLQDEYDERSQRARRQHIALQRHVFGQVVTAYVRMTKDAMAFQAKKRAVVRIQAAFRGRLARRRIDRLRRAALRPYAIDSIRVRGFRGGDTDADSGSAVAGDDLRLANGFTCNPYVYVSVVDGGDDENQLFCFETGLRKSVSLHEPDVAWADRLFVPGVDGNATVCFTLLSKNGPNNFFLGQAVLRLRDADVAATATTTDLLLADEVEIFPKTTQRQPLRLVEVGGAPKRRRASGSHSRHRPLRRERAAGGLFANSVGSVVLALSARVAPFRDAHAHCGYLGLKHTLASAQTSARWCVLADGVLRLYRHLGVTLASDVVDMARATDVRLADAATGAGGGARPRCAQLCIAIHHVGREFLLQADRAAGTKIWLKKLQAAAKLGGNSLAVELLPTAAVGSVGSVGGSLPAAHGSIS